MDKISFKNDTIHNKYTPRRADRPIGSLHFKHTDSLGNTHPLKAARNFTVDVTPPNQSNI